MAPINQTSYQAEYGIGSRHFRNQPRHNFQTFKTENSTPAPKVKFQSLPVPASPTKNGEKFSAEAPVS